MSRKNKIVDWRPLVEKWQCSGLNKTDFCRQNRIDINRFKYHSVKLHAYSRPRATGATGSSVGGDVFAEVVCSPAAASEPFPKAMAAMGKAASEVKSSLILRLECGGSIELSTDFDMEILKRVLKIARDL